MRGQSLNGSPTGQARTSRRASSVIASASSRMRSPWKRGSISLRRAMCSGSSLSITECAPSTGRKARFGTPTPRSSVSAEKTRLTSSGSARRTQVPRWRRRSVKVAP